MAIDLNQPINAILSGLDTRLAALETPAPTPATIPAGLFMDMDAASITGVADGGAVSSWNDSKGTVVFAQATAGSQPAYVANALNGHPGVKFAGGPFLTASRSGSASALNTLINTQKHTTYIIATGVGGSFLGYAFGASNGDNSYFAIADGTRIGRFNGSFDGMAIPYSGTGFIGFGFSSTTDASGGSGNGLERVYANGCCVASNVSPIPGTANDFSFGARADGQLSANITILRAFIFDHELTPVEMIQLHKYVCDKFGQTYPWAGSEFLLCIGDSQTAAVGADQPSYGAPYQLAARRGLKLGQYSQLGIGGIAVNLATTPASGAQMQARIPKDIHGTAALLGLSPKFFVGEFYNQRNEANPAGNMATYLQSLKKESPSSKIALWTSFTFAADTASSPDAHRAAYNSYWDTATNRNGLVDAYVPIHTDANIGVAGACPPSSPFGSYFSDGVHLTGKSGYPGTASGYPYFADKAQQALAAASF